MPLQALPKYVRPLEHKSKAVRVVERIIESILAGDLQPGDFLPTERQLTETLEVSRATVREAYTALAVAGLIVSKSGTGTHIVRVRNANNLKRRALSILASRPAPYEVWKAREVFESSLGDLIIEARTDDDLKALEEAVLALESSVAERELDGFFKADEEFHEALIEATHSACVSLVLGPLLEFMHDPIERTMKSAYTLASPGKLASAISAHRRIYDSVLRKDIRGFRKAMEDHFGPNRELGSTGDFEETDF